MLNDTGSPSGEGVLNDTGSPSGEGVVNDTGMLNYTESSNDAYIGEDKALLIDESLSLKNTTIGEIEVKNKHSYDIENKIKIKSEYSDDLSDNSINAFESNSDNNSTSFFSNLHNNLLKLSDIINVYIGSLSVFSSTDSPRPKRHIRNGFKANDADIEAKADPKEQADAPTLEAPNVPLAPFSIEGKLSPATAYDDRSPSMRGANEKGDGYPPQYVGENVYYGLYEYQQNYETKPNIGGSGIQVVLTLPSPPASRVPEPVTSGVPSPQLYVAGSARSFDSPSNSSNSTLLGGEFLSDMVNGTGGADPSNLTHIPVLVEGLQHFRRMCRCSAFNGTSPSSPAPVASNATNSTDTLCDCFMQIDHSQHNNRTRRHEGAKYIDLHGVHDCSLNELAHSDSGCKDSPAFEHRVDGRPKKTGHPNVDNGFANTTYVNITVPVDPPASQSPDVIVSTDKSDDKNDTDSDRVSLNNHHHNATLVTTTFTVPKNNNPLALSPTEKHRLLDTVDVNLDENNSTESSTSNSDYEDNALESDKLTSPVFTLVAEDTSYCGDHKSHLKNVASNFRSVIGKLFNIESSSVLIIEMTPTNINVDCSRGGSSAEQEKSGTRFTFIIDTNKESSYLYKILELSTKDKDSYLRRELGRVYLNRMSPNVSLFKSSLLSCRAALSRFPNILFDCIQDPVLCIAHPEDSTCYTSPNLPGCFCDNPDSEQCDAIKICRPKIELDPTAYCVINPYAPGCICVTQPSSPHCGCYMNITNPGCPCDLNPLDQKCQCMRNPYTCSVLKSSNSNHGTFDRSNLSSRSYIHVFLILLFILL